MPLLSTARAILVVLHMTVLYAARLKHRRANMSDDYLPVAGNAAWMPLMTVNVGQYTFTETFGTQHQSQQTQTFGWASAVSSTLSTSMKAGVKFFGSGIEVEVGASLTSDMSVQHANQKQYSWAMTSEETFSWTIENVPGQSSLLWQWHIRTALRNGDVVFSKTRDFVITRGYYEPPRCVPGWCNDPESCQSCNITEAEIQGLGPAPPPPTPSPTPAPSPGPTPPPTQARSPAERMQGFNRIWTLAGAAGWFGANTKVGLSGDAENDRQVMNTQGILMTEDWAGSALEPMAQHITLMALFFCNYAIENLWDQVNETSSYDYAQYVRYRENVRLVLNGAGMPSDELFTQIDIVVTELSWYAAKSRKFWPWPQSNELAEVAWERTNTQLDQLFSARAWPLWDQ